ncbi:MAG TPA: endonuclease/exonuclease/phosphatase family protein [Chloroflexota bacterium]|nr:endonuclease/exonuclease/phosphatase family protein [Chloroflexota bacterium]
MTLNIWNYNRPWPKRRALIASLIMNLQPDVVCLQETRHDWRYDKGRGQGEQLADATGYHPTWAVGQVYVPILRVDEGLTILTRSQPERVMSRRLTRLPHEREDENQRVCLGVGLDIEGREVHVYDAHFSLSEAARLANARECAELVRTESGSLPSLLMGDLNARPDTPPIRFLTGEPVIDGEAGDFADCWAAVHGDEPGFTYSSNRPYHRIDYVLARNLEGRIAAAHIVGGDPEDGVYPSDHLGIVVDINLAGGPAMASVPQLPMLDRDDGKETNGASNHN